MKKKEDHADALERASDLLAPVAPHSVRPAQCIRPAVELASEAYARMQYYLKPAAVSALRVNILRLRGVLQALDANRLVTSADYEAVRRVAVAFRDLADDARPEQTVTTTMPATALGLRNERDLPRALELTTPCVMISNGRRVTAGDATHEVLQDKFHDMEQHREAMPRGLTGGQPFALFRCPIVAFLKNFVGDAALDRSGLTWSRMPGSSLPVSPGLGRVTERGLHALILDNQILVGLDRARLAEDRDGYVRAVTDQLQARLGRMTPPLGETGRFLISPGNPLSWLWLVPSRVMTTTHLTVIEANFPWKTEHQHIDEGKRHQMQKEVRELNDRAARRQQQGIGLDVNDLTRQSQLLELLERSEKIPNGVNPDLAKRRLAMQARIDARSRNLIAQLADYRQQLKETGTVGKHAREIQAHIKDLGRQIAAIRDEEMRNARSRP